MGLSGIMQVIYMYIFIYFGQKKIIIKIIRNPRKKIPKKKNRRYNISKQTYIINIGFLNFCKIDFMSKSPK